MEEKNYIKKLISAFNYHTWSEAVMSLMLKYDYDLCLEPSDVDPSLPKIAVARTQKKARGVLASAIDDSLLEGIKEFETAFDLWNHLKTTY